MTDVPIRIKVDSTGAVKGGQSVVRSLDQIKKKAGETNKATGQLNKSIKDTGDVAAFAKRSLAGLVAAFGIREVLTTADAYNTLQIRIKTATAATGDFARVSNDLFAIAQRTGTQLQTNVEVFQRIALGARDLGRSNQDVLQLVDSVQKLGVIGGSSNEALRAGLTQLGQGLSAGILRAEEFNSVVENIPEVANAIARGLGTTTGQLRQLVLDGKVLSEDVFSALLAQTDSIDNQFANIPLSLGRAVTIAGNNLGKFFSDLDQATETTSNLAGAIVTVTSAIAEQGDKIRNVFNSLNALIITTAGEFVKFISTIDSINRAIIASILAPFRKIGDVFSAFRQDLKEFISDPLFTGSSFDKLGKELEVGFTEEFTQAFQAVRSEGQQFNTFIDQEVDEQLLALRTGASDAAQAIAGDDAGSLANSMAKGASEADKLNKAIEPMAETFKNTANGIKDSFDDLFFDIFRNGELSFKGFIDNLKDGFARMLSELATLAIAKPILIPAVGGIGGALGLSQSAIASVTGELGGGGGLGGVSSIVGLGKSILGSGTIGNVVGGLGGNLLANTLLGGDRGPGANVGGALGGLAGTLLPVPVLGSAIGSALGNVIGGLFGGSKPSDKTQTGVLDLATGNIERFGLTGKKFSQENFDAVTQLIDLASVVSQTVGGTGNVRVVVGNREGLRLSTGGGPEEQFGQDINALTEALIKGVVESGTEISQELKDAIVNNIDFSDIGKALSQIEIAVGFDQNIQNQINSIVNPQLQQLQQLADIQEQRRQQALTFGGDLVEIEKLFALEREQIVMQSSQAQISVFRNQIDTIDRIQRGLALSESFSGTNALGRAQEADRQLQSLLERVKAGDETVFQDLDSTINQSLDAALDYYGSTAPFLERLSLVDTILESSRSLAQSQLTTEEQILASQTDNNSLTEQLLAESIKQTALLNTQLAQESKAFLEDPKASSAAQAIAAASTVASEVATTTSSTVRDLFIGKTTTGPNVLKKSRFLDRIDAFADGTGNGTFSGLAMVGEEGPELVNFGRPAQIFNNGDTQGLLTNNGEAIDEAFGRFARQSSEETTFIGGILMRVLDEIRELNDNVSLGAVERGTAS
jgi:tape measure domain-containing protein